MQDAQPVMADLFLDNMNCHEVLADGAGVELVTAALLDKTTQANMSVHDNCGETAKESNDGANSFLIGVQWCGGRVEKALRVTYRTRSKLKVDIDYLLCAKFYSAKM